MQDLQIFKFDNQNVRTITIDEEPYFVANDVAKILGYKKTRNAIARHVELDDVKVAPIRGPLGGVQTTKVINESGLYSLILSSKMPEAKKFKHWVTGEVLPAIRQHGAYLTDQKALDIITNKDGLAGLLKQAADQLEQKDIQIKKLEPKALFADAVSASDDTILIGELAKILKGKGVNIGQNRLFKWMRDNGYLINRKGSDRNIPTQKSMELGLFKIKETVINHPEGKPSIRKTPKVTGKGQQYFVDKFVAQNEAMEA
ncbi:phage antirepressor [Lactobacillus sp.]|uniref:phage antirepressor n=1 Tax=Lactobacillus sp. TaxID=1591 RepID=UPI00258AA2A0|nr:phage antirepressor [Lactobacillus sp.]MCO6530446.1 phage antirepressor [Lactobacillus sp.]